jgi:hypothetical protein
MSQPQRQFVVLRRVRLLELREDSEFVLMGAFEEVLEMM